MSFFFSILLLLSEYVNIHHPLMLHYIHLHIQVAFQQVYRVLKNGGTFLICNESNGKNTKDEKWTDIIHGMTIYTSEQIEKELENAGFSKIEVDQNQKDWLCLVCKKDD